MIPAVNPLGAVELKRRYDALKGSPERSNWEAHCQEVGEVISPRKIDFVGLRTAGEKRMNRVYDETAIHANEMLAAGIHGMFTNDAALWFQLRMISAQVVDNSGAFVDLNEVPEVREFLSHVQDVIWARIYEPGTNFTTALHEAYLDLGAFGTAVIYLGQRDSGGLLFECLSLAECVIAENIDGRVDTLFRKTTYTVRQMVDMVGAGVWSSVSDRVMDLFRSNRLDDNVDVIHVVLPRQSREPGKKGSKDMPFASIYFEHQGEHILSEGGYPEFPFLVPRWSKYAREVYGRGPGMTALPAVKMLQAMAVTTLKALQKAVDPPMWLKDDGVVGQVRTIPGGINYWRGDPQAGVMLHPTRLDGLNMAAQEMEVLRNRIRTMFFTDILQFVTDQKMTATEVMARTQERMRLLGPLGGRLSSELLGPMIARIYGIVDRMGLLPEPPEIISEKEFTVEYLSPITTAQRQQSAMGIMQVYQLLAPLGPEVAAQILMKKVDPGKLIEWAWERFNCDPDLLLDEDDQQQAGQMEKAMQAMQMAQPMAEVAAKGGQAVKSLADSQAGGGIDLQQLLGSFANAAQSSPRAQEEVQSMMNGQQPPPQ